MFIKLTRLDNTPIWINAAFVVTVEPRKGGGSVVVPIGDGLDYDVRETTDQVLAMLGDAPVHTSSDRFAARAAHSGDMAVVPVPAPKMLAPTPEDVSPDAEPAKDVPPAEAPAEEPKPAKRTRRTKKTAAAETTEDEAEKKPVKRTRRTKKATVEEVVEEKSAVDFPEEHVARLKKMMPGSKRKLWNTLVTQFKVADAEAVVDFLQERGVIEVGSQNHIIWK